MGKWHLNRPWLVDILLRLAFITAFAWIVINLAIYLGSILEIIPPSMPRTDAATPVAPTPMTIRCSEKQN